MPVFEGLFGKYNGLVMDLLWYLLVWHTLAELSWHTDGTLAALGSASRALGWSLWCFKRQLCDKKETFESSCEQCARTEREGKKNKGKKTVSSSCKRCTFNLSTYKLHPLGNYVAYIMLFGPSDSWSTLRVCWLPISQASGLITLAGRTGTLPHEAILPSH
jgi:hypothetical protein